MSHSNAWLLFLGDHHRAAVGERELIHLVHEPALTELPTTPRHCRHVVVWRNNLLPVVDLAAWLNRETHRSAPSLIGIFAYWAGPGDLQHGALALASAPQRALVSDQQACSLPKTSAAWRSIARACFYQDEQAVSILALEQLFSTALVSSDTLIAA